MCLCLMMVFILGGPALFVLSWAIIKAFAVENDNLDGVSIFNEKFYVIIIWQVVAVSLCCVDILKICHINPNFKTLNTFTEIPFSSFVNSIF